MSSSSTISAATRERPYAANPRRRRQAILPPALQSRPQSDRAGLRQAQDLAPKGGRTHCRGNLEAHWRFASLLHTAGMRQLPRQLRIRFKMKQSCSRLRCRTPSRLLLLVRPRYRRAARSLTCVNERRRGRRGCWGTRAPLASLPVRVPISDPVHGGHVGR
jgi:hypothetical protein